MPRVDVYVDMDGQPIFLGQLDADERRLLGRIRRRARTHPSWVDFRNYWVRAVGEFYDARRVPRKVTRDRAVYRVAQDLWSRLGIAAGLVRPDDYRSELEELIRKQFASERAFCEATGIGEEALKEFLAGRRELAPDVLNEALARVGYRLHIIPSVERKKTG